MVYLQKKSLSPGEIQLKGCFSISPYEEWKVSSWEMPQTECWRFLQAFIQDPNLHMLFSSHLALHIHWESLAHFAKHWVMRALKSSLIRGRELKPKKLKLSCSFSRACLVTFGLCLTHVPVSWNDLSSKFHWSSLSVKA